MSSDKNNIAVVNTTDIVHLINELRILNATTLHNLSSANGLIPQLNENITILNGKNNLNKALIIKEERIKNDAKNAQKELSDNLQHLDEILNEFKNFERIQEQLLSEQAGKIKDFNLDLNAKANLYQKEIISLKDLILSDLRKQIEEIKNQINFKIVDIDIRNLEMINQNASKAINNITAVADWNKNVYHVNIILIVFISLFGGGILASLIFYFFLK